ncbi:hypothetical protein [Erythrobacter colymbi]|uniref:hypothetical protein n=1 Tax=Erythrobacter colymbi TaxID=1161202 RepID=UPI000A3887BD|nr:hypothetical protein [Erythrobacter colymbi]
MIRDVTNLLSLLPDMPSLTVPLANGAAVLPAEGAAGLDFAGLLGAATVPPPSVGTAMQVLSAATPDVPATLPGEVPPTLLPATAAVLPGLPGGKTLPEPGAHLPPALPLAARGEVAEVAAPLPQVVALPEAARPSPEPAGAPLAEGAPVAIVVAPALTPASTERPEIIAPEPEVAPLPEPKPAPARVTTVAPQTAVPVAMSESELAEDTAPSEPALAVETASDPDTDTDQPETVAAVPLPAPVLLAALATPAPISAAPATAPSPEAAPAARIQRTATLTTAAPRPALPVTPDEATSDPPASPSPVTPAALSTDPDPAAAPATTPALAAATPDALPSAAQLAAPQHTPATPAPERAAAQPVPAPQLESTIAQVGDIREALRSARPSMTVHHAEFGMVSLRLEQAAPEQWRAVLASRDPGFIPAVQAALADRAVAATADASASFTGQHGGMHQNGTSDHRYGASPNGGQGSSQPYLGQSGSRDGEAAPDHRRPSTAAALAGRGGSEERDEGSASHARAQGGLFA